MNRSFVVMGTGLCAAPLLSLAGFAITSLLLPSGGGGADSSIARGYAGLVGGITFAVAGFFLLWWAANRFVAPEQIGYLFAADVALLLIGIFAWRGMLATGRTIEYAAGRGVLQVEVRIPRTILGAEHVDAVVSIDFAGGSGLSEPHPEAVRDDGDAVILPWETTPVRVRTWEVRVILRNEPVLFVLPLPRLPDNSIEWSDWIRPSAGRDATPSDKVTLRYRFLVIPYGQ